MGGGSSARYAWQPLSLDKLAKELELTGVAYNEKTFHIVLRKKDSRICASYIAYSQ